MFFVCACSLLNYFTFEGQMYCKPHFLEASKTKGMHSTWIFG